jgi:hypothetical protein
LELIKIRISFFLLRLSPVFKQEVVSDFLSLALLRKPNREAKAWRRWWWCWSTRLHSVRRSRAPTSSTIKGEWMLKRTYLYACWFFALPIVKGLYMVCNLMACGTNLQQRKNLDPRTMKKCNHVLT